MGFRLCTAPRCACILTIAAGYLTLPLTAGSPEGVREGKAIFERDWQPGNPAMGGDGLGPVFNGRSCVACHNQGGVGGSGDSRFNAISIGIEAIEVNSGTRIGRGEIGQHVRQFYPGFIQPDRTIMNSAPLPHHGGSESFRAFQSRLRSRMAAARSDEGGPINAEEARLATAEPILFSSRVGNKKAVIRARLFQRNTTSLFGAGLIDAIPAKAIEQQARQQEADSEVSGRVSMLRDGSVGRFGWRANVNRLMNFVDRACANELSLETKRRAQGVDPTRPGYRNSTIDIDDSQIEAMSSFISDLPAPVREIPTSAVEELVVRTGEMLFERIGCATCHVPNLGPAQGIYSDILLHDMGPYLYDLDAAEPYVVRQTLTKELRELPRRQNQFVGYYGSSSSIDDFDAEILPDGRLSGLLVSPRRSKSTTDFVSFAKSDEIQTVTAFQSGTLNRFSRRANTEAREEMGIRRHLQPSNTTQEWRTPPLWGLRDSEPYMHDGRASTVLEAIVLHDGEAAGSRDRYLSTLSLTQRNAILAFLDTLVAPSVKPAL